MISIKQADKTSLFVNIVRLIQIKLAHLLSESIMCTAETVNPTLCMYYNTRQIDV